MCAYYYNNKMKLPELKSLLILHNIRGGAHLNKPELIALLVAKGILVQDNSDNFAQKQRQEQQQKHGKEYRKEYQKEYRKKYWEEYRNKRKVGRVTQCSRVEV